MSVLSLDTAGPDPSVAVLSGGRIFEEILPAGGRASEELLPAIERALAAARLRLTGCERIAVCAGPGSFTGVRVGLATAWGLGRAVGIPVESVPTLEAMAEAARPLGDLRVAAFLDAGRGEIVGALYDLSGERARPLVSPTRMTGAGVPRFAAGAGIVSLPRDLVSQTGRALPASLAASLAHAVSRSPRAGTELPSAIYARPSAAEEKHGPA